MKSSERKKKLPASSECLQPQVKAEPKGWEPTRPPSKVESRCGVLRALTSGSNAGPGDRGNVQGQYLEFVKGELWGIKELRRRARESWEMLQWL